MKVVHLSSVHYALDTRIFHRECVSLVEIGFKVDLLVQWDKNEYLHGINIIALPQVSSKINRILKVIPSIWRIATTYPKSTIFHFHDSELIPVGLLLKRKGYKVIYDVHEDVPNDLLSKKWIPKWLRKPLSVIIRKIEKIADNKLDAIISVTEEINNRFSNKNNFIVRNYPNYSEFNIYEDSNLNYFKRKLNISYIGEIQVERGIHHIIQALPQIAQKYPSINFDMGGKITSSYKEQLESLQGWRNTTFHGWINREKLPKILKSARLGLLVLDKHPNFEYSKPVKLFEYMLSGIPIIASNFPYWKQLIGDANCCLFVEPSNPNAIAQAIEWIFDNPIEAKEMGERGKDFALKNFSWETEFQNLQTCYKQVMSNG